LPVICTCWLHSIYLCTPVTVKLSVAVSHPPHRSPCVAVPSPRAYWGARDFLPQPHRRLGGRALMKTLTVLLGAAAGVAATISVGAGVAAAVPDVVGQTYKDAKNTIQGQGIGGRYRDTQR